MNKTVDLLTAQYEVLGHEGLGFTEIRLPKKGIQKFAQDLKGQIEGLQSELLKGDMYVGINPRKSQSGKAEDVSYVTCIFIDLDPVRPKGLASSNEQHDEALQQGSMVFKEFGGSLLVDSGSGAHVYIPINPIENKDTQKLTQALHAFNYEIKSKYETATIKVDAVFDLPRIARIWGSFNEKSQRLCKPVAGLDTYKRIDFDLEKYSKLSLQSSTKILTPKLEINNRFDKLLSLNNNLKDMFNGVGKYASRSEADFALTSYLITAKFTDQEILDIRKKSPMSKSEDRSDTWILSDITRIRQKHIVKSEGISTIDDNYFKDLENRKPGTLTGFVKLDNMMAGLKEGRVVVLCARPSNGKTTLLTQIAKNLAENKKRVLFFPTESGASVIYDKIISSKTGINLDKFEWGNFTTDDKERISNVADDIKKLPIFVVENFALRVEDVERHIKEIAPDIVFIDYFANFVFPNAGKPEDQAVVAAKIKEMSLKYSIPIVLAQQLNRGSESSAASLTHIKGTGKIEEVADYVMFLYTLDKNVQPQPVNLDIMKSRFGKVGLIKMELDANVCTFREK